MDEEKKDLLERTYKLAKENNKMIHRLQNKARLSSLVSSVKWIVIIIATFMAYQFLQPFLEQAQGVITSVQDTADTVQDIKTQADDGIGGLKEFFGR